MIAGSRPRGRSTAAAVAAALALGTVIWVGIGSSGEPERSPPPKQPAGRAPITVNSQNWIEYDDPLVRQLHLVHPATRIISGHTDGHGGCDIQGSVVAGPGSSDTFQVEVAYNPIACQEKVLTGGLTPADKAILDGASSGPGESSSSAAAAPASG